MPHAVIRGASQPPSLEAAPLWKEANVIFRVVEVARAPKGWLLKCAIIHPGSPPRRFLARLDMHEEGMVAHLDDHMPIERDDEVFHFLALLAEGTLRANPGSTIGKTNLQKWLAPG